MNRLKLGFASLLLMAACTGFPFFGRKPPSSPDRGTIQDAGHMDARIPPRTMMEIQDIQYDGWTLSGRVLVSPEEGQLRLDRRLIPTIHVEIRRVSECEHGSVTSIRGDLIAPRARPEDLLVLEPGYWYGTTVRFKLFSEYFTGLGPECVQADIILLSFDGKRVARQRIRAVRPPQATDGGTQLDGGMQPLDGGMQEAPPSPPDAGAP
jgi:hypothetical protein